jgi:protein required for attachment to host cells
LDIASFESDKLRSSQDGVTEEDVQRVKDQDQQAKQVHQQIKQEGKKNNNIAKFVSFLLKNIHDDELIRKLHQLFFLVKQAETGTIYKRKTINMIVLAGLFIPFYSQQVQEYTLEEIYKNLSNHKVDNTEHYLEYLHQLSGTLHDNIALDKIILLETVARIIIYFKLQEVHSLEEKNQLIHDIDRALYPQ